jgi:uncharacterized protein (DUF433 family)
MEVANPQLLGGKLVIRGTRLSVSLILECLAGGMSLEDIDQAFDSAFPHEALAEVLKVASELTDSFRGGLTPTWMCIWSRFWSNSVSSAGLGFGTSTQSRGDSSRADLEYG